MEQTNKQRNKHRDGGKTEGTKWIKNEEEKNKWTDEQTTKGAYEQMNERTSKWKIDGMDQWKNEK